MTGNAPHAPRTPRRLTRRTTFGLALAGLLPALAGCTAPFGSMGRGVFVVDANGDNLHRIADGSPALAWSDDSTELALRYDDGRILVASASGSGAHQGISKQFTGPGWSPSGNELAVIDAGRNMLRIETSDGTVVGETPLREELPPLWMVADIAHNVPVWSPDGDRIAFLAWDGNGDALYTVNATGSGRQKLTSVQISQNRVDSYDWLGQRAATGDVGNPAWSPDGQRLAFAVFPEVQGATGGIYTVPAAGGPPTRITDRSPATGPAWSPDGSQIAYTARQDRFIKLFVASADGTSQRSLTDRLNRNARYPDWSPDGQWLAFAGGADLFTIDLAGGFHQIASTGLVTKYPVWSPDGTKIAFLGVPAQPGR